LLSSSKMEDTNRTNVRRDVALGAVFLDDSSFGTFALPTKESFEFENLTGSIPEVIGDSVQIGPLEGIGSQYVVGDLI